MPEVSDYMSGKILNMVKKGFRSFKLIRWPLVGPIIQNKMGKVLDKCAAQKIDVNAAIELIQASKNCAVGERVCNTLHRDAELGWGNDCCDFRFERIGS